MTHLTQEFSRLTCVSDGGKPLELGSGFFGSVFKGFLAKEDGTKLPVAIKILKSLLFIFF